MDAVEAFHWARLKIHPNASSRVEISLATARATRITNETIVPVAGIEISTVIQNHKGSVVNQ